MRTMQKFYIMLPYKMSTLHLMEESGGHAKLLH